LGEPAPLTLLPSVFSPWIVNLNFATVCMNLLAADPINQRLSGQYIAEIRHHLRWKAPWSETPSILQGLESFRLEKTSL